MYESAPFDGVKAVEDYENTYLMSVVKLDKEKYKTEAAAIGDKVSSEKAREWKQRLKEYNDEKEFRRREQENSHTRTMATIAACRSAAEKWAENQPQTKVYLNW